MNSDKEAVKVLAEGMVKAIRQAVKENNKDYVNNQVKKYSGNASSFSGAINASQVKGLYSGDGFYGSVANIISHAKTNYDEGDQIAGSIVSAINSLANLEVKSIAADTAQIGDLYASFGQFMNLIAQNAMIGNLDVQSIRANLAQLGIANIGNARISSAQIDVADVNTAFIRQGVGDKYYIDNLSVTDSNLLNLTVGNLMLRDANGQLVKLGVDNKGNVVSEHVQISGETAVLDENGDPVLDEHGNPVMTSIIESGTLNGAVITDNTITAQQLNASEIFAKNATIMNIIASNISVSTLLAQQGLIQELQTSIISSPDFAEIIDGESIDISNNTAITVANGLIGLMIDTEDPEATSITLTDKMISAVSDNIDIIAKDYITTRVEDTIENEIITQDDSPTNPTEGLIWVDTSKNPNRIYQWDGLKWVQIDGTTLDGNSILINKLIQNMSSRISQKNDEILLQVTRDENAEIEGHVETLNTYVSQIKQQADELSLMVANMSTSYVQIGVPVIKAEGEVWFDPSNANYYVSSLLIDDGNLEFAYDDDGRLLYKYSDGSNEDHSFKVENNNLMVSYDGEDEDINVDFQVVGGRLGSWRIIENVAFSKLAERVDGISATVYDSTKGLSAVSQQADKINWLVANGTSSANMTITNDALNAIAKDIALGAERIVLSADHTISAESAKYIDLSANGTINITAPMINAVADQIQFSSNNSTLVSIANNAASSAANAVANSKNKVYAQNNAPSGSNYLNGDLWIDTNDNNKLYRWDGTKWTDSRDTSLDAVVNGKTTTYYSSSAPKKPNVGDIWCDAKNNLIKRYTSSGWSDITNSVLNKALNLAQDAQNLAEIKISTYAQDEEPEETDDLHFTGGDLWIDTNNNNELYRWNDAESEWINIRDKTNDTSIANMQATITNITSEIGEENIISNITKSQYFIDGVNGILEDEEYSTITQTSNAIIAEIGKITIGSRNLALNTEDIVSFTGKSSSNMYTAEWILSDRGKTELDTIGKEYTISFTAKSTVSNNQIYICAVKYDLNGNIELCSELNAVGEYKAMPITSLSTDYQRYENTMKISKSGATAIRVCVLLNPNPGTISMQLVQVEAGNKASSWNAAPEDFEADISGIQEDISTIQDDFARVIRIEEDGLHVGDNQTNGEVVIDSESVNVVVNEVQYSKFAADYVQFGNYQLRRTSDGGLAFKMYNS